ncbi:MAG: S46 family peptidase [Thermoguttaceae bacterium]|jgi:hypothetical protein
MNKRLASGRWAAAMLLVLCTASVRGDEGMWLFNNPPRQILKERYDFEPTPEWLLQLQRSSVRFNSGGSGSFVSSDGLVLTNHHVGADALQKLSSKSKNYLADGFYAATRAEEVKCLDLELNVLMSIEDVTRRINAAVKPGSSLAEAERIRRAVMNTIEQESLASSGLRSDVVTLYHGGLYHLYRFKKYTDVRLVFAPEESAAFFGGDPDNFEYPRYDLDICFFRVYENGKPVKAPYYLKWSRAGAADGELVFVSGHPGKTDRFDTLAHFEFLRDRLLPFTLERIRRREIVLSTYGQRSAENARRAREELFNVQNARKADVGRLDGLQDPAVMDRKRSEEQAFRQAVAQHPQLRRTCERAWDDVAAALATWRKINTTHVLLEQGAAFDSGLFHLARALVRMAEELRKPNAERLREYGVSRLESMRLWLFSEAPIYDDLETVKLGDSLALYVERAGAGDELVRSVLAGKSPRERAAELVAGTQLKSVAFRKKLAEGGLPAVEACDDAMIRLARLVDAPARNVRRMMEQQVEEPARQAYAKIADARFVLYGTNQYPDATFSLRLAFGVVRGYSELGRQLPPWTTLGGAFQHAEEHGNQEPFALPPRWFDHRARLDPATPLNFVSTADIIGGNSGSPVVNRKNEFVGIIFDGNLQSLVWDFVYDDKQGRALAVHSSAIEETLRKLYDAGPLADELGR